ncbi:MAG: HAMP domain-containing protein [Betaproteobacteria bacterium]|nr:HAMP domain-containing protein [Betaproteobacteria bacterium]
MKMGIGGRLIASFAVVGVLLLGVAATGMTGIQWIGDGLTQVVENRYPRIETVNETINEVNTISIAARNALIADNSDEIATQLERVKAGQRNLEVLRDNLDQILVSGAHAGEAEQSRQTLREHSGHHLSELDNVTGAIRDNNKWQAQVLLLEKLNPRQTLYLSSLRELIERETLLMRQDQRAAQDLVFQGRIFIIVILLVAALATALLALALKRRMVRPLERASRLADAIAQGDLTQHIAVSGQDETAMLAASLNTMKSRLAPTLSNIKQVSSDINTAAGEIAQGNQSLAARTEQQVAALEKTAASLEELTSAVRQNAENTRKASALSATASEVAAKSGRAINDVVITMSGISESSKRISDIIGVIDGIAFQTNILALNAAVEAARAGEQGRGFSVVAAEVRSLAQRSAASAREIKSLIDDSAGKVESGAALVDDAGYTIGELMESVRQVSDLISDIAAANQEQNSGIEQVNVAVTQMDQASQQNAALVEQVSATAESMRDQAAALMNAVNAFELGETAPAPAPFAVTGTSRSSPAVEPFLPNTRRTTLSAPRQ